MMTRLMRARATRVSAHMKTKKSGSEPKGGLPGRMRRRPTMAKSVADIHGRKAGWK